MIRHRGALRIGVGDERGVAIGGAEEEEHALAGLELLAAELEWFTDPAGDELDRGVVAEHLLDQESDSDMQI